VLLLLLLLLLRRRKWWLRWESKGQSEGRLPVGGHGVEAAQRGASKGS